jgi:hypothetical protein
MKIKIMAQYDEEVCEVLMINFQSGIVGLRLRSKSTVYMDAEPPYTQKVVPINDIEHMWFKLELEEDNA